MVERLAATGSRPLRASSTLGQWLRRADRWRWIVRYHRPSQLAWRLTTAARRSLLRRRRGGKWAQAPVFAPPLRNAAGLRRLLPQKLAEREDAAETVAGVRAGRFCFLNQAVELSDPIDWRVANRPDVSRLWRFHLHYHQFLLDFAAQAESDVQATEQAWRIVEQWIEANPPSDPRGYDDAWHPFCISRRLPVWMLLATAAPPSPDAAARILANLFLQARFLASHLERDLGGNHLLENAKALALAGAFFDGPQADAWLEASHRLFRRELAEQILPHGEHFERSPMYHAQTLAALLDVRDACEEVHPALSALCGDHAARMAEFLQAILHPDGDIPLFGDSALNETPPIAQLLDRAGCNARGDKQPCWPPESPPVGPVCRTGPSESRTPNDNSRSRPADRNYPAPASKTACGYGASQVGDYWVWRDGGDCLIFDAGPVGADHLPAHAHADLLTIEASLAGRRLIVDTGVFNYEDDAMRRLCRGTAAHNVLQVDGQDHCDMWSRFRMGRRGKPQELAIGVSAGFHWARASHNAYRRLRVSRVTRWIACRAGGPWICLDAAQGQGVRQLTSWLHLAPGTEIEVAGPWTVKLRHADAVYELNFLAPGELRVTQGWHCPRFGVRQEAPVLQWSTQARLPQIAGWFLRWQGEGEAILDHTGHLPTLIWSEEGREVRLASLNL